MTPITLEQYFGKYINHPDATPERKENARRLLAIVNEALEAAERDSVPLTVNKKTGSYISGDGNGGFRPQDCPVGAPGSPHKKALGIDLADPDKELQAWSKANEDVLRHLGIVAMEDERWTPGWCHWQIVEVASGKFLFIPSREKPLTAAAPERLA